MLARQGGVSAVDAQQHRLGLAVLQPHTRLAALTHAAAQTGAAFPASAAFPLHRNHGKVRADTAGSAPCALGVPRCLGIQLWPKTQQRVAQAAAAAAAYLPGKEVGGRGKLEYEVGPAFRQVGLASPRTVGARVLSVLGVGTCVCVCLHAAARLETRGKLALMLSSGLDEGDGQQYTCVLS